VGGQAIEEFESAFASFCGTAHAVGVGSGTDALRFAIMACGVNRGDVVLTVPNTFIATTEAISQAGATPEFIDIDERTYNLSVPKLQQFLETRCVPDAKGRLISLRLDRPVTAIVPVHLNGQMADMDPILRLADKYGLTVIEDAFSKRFDRWMKAGSMGRAAAFSFYPGKNLGACGEGGAVTTNDSAVASHIKSLRDHGQTKKYYHEEEGYNGRLDAIQAGLLVAKLPHLGNWNAKRQERAAEYNRLLAERDALALPFEPSWSRAVYHLYVVRTHDREGMIAHLKGAGISTGIHYPVPLHLQLAYASLNYEPGDFPVAERTSAAIVSLPMFPQLSGQQQLRVAAAIEAFGAKAAHKLLSAEDESLELANVAR
jgi:dTDP-4-amino-4,6-dideoxygalactose transaminase